MRIPDPFTLVIFGGTGDLSHRKLFPALFKLYLQNRLPSAFKVLALGRKSIADELFRKQISSSLMDENDPEANKKELLSFSGHIHYQSLDMSSKSDFIELKQRLQSFGEDVHQNLCFCRVADVPSDFSGRRQWQRPRASCASIRTAGP